MKLLMLGLDYCLVFLDDYVKLFWFYIGMLTKAFITSPEQKNIAFLQIYLSLEGASKEKVVTDFKPKSLELKVHDVNGKNYRFIVPKLCKTINPEASTIIVKPTRIILTLKKVDKGTWADLHSKEDKVSRVITHVCY